MSESFSNPLLVAPHPLVTPIIYWIVVMVYCFASAGIANALDLTDRILPRLQAKPNCKSLDKGGREIYNERVSVYS